MLILGTVTVAGHEVRLLLECLIRVKLHLLQASVKINQNGYVSCHSARTTKEVVYVQSIPDPTAYSLYPLKLCVVTLQQLTPACGPSTWFMSHTNSMVQTSADYDEDSYG